jgi:RNA polymerase sigma factor FliA
MKTADPFRDSLIEQGQPLVHSLAAKIHRSTGSHAELQDLIAYGELGLAEAAKDFDPSQKCRFTTFAYYRIRGAIYDGLSKMFWASRAQYHRLRFEQLADEALSADAGSSPEAESLMSNASWLGSVAQRLAVVYFVTRGEPQAGGIRDSTVEDPGMASAQNIVAQREIVSKLHELVDALPEVERRLISRVYFDGVTLQEAAHELRISKSWASRLHARILEKLANSLRRIGAND